MDTTQLFVGAIKTQGVILDPLVEKQFSMNFHFSKSMFKYEYIESDNEAGLIINYNSREITLFAREFNIKKTHTSTLTDFQEKYDSLVFFKACVNDFYSKIKLPPYAESKSNYGEMNGNKYDLISYRDEHGSLTIRDLKINAPSYVPAITFENRPRKPGTFRFLMRMKGSWEHSTNSV